MTDETVPGEFRQQIRPVLMVVLIVFLNLFSRSLVAPLLVEIEGNFHISHAIASRFFLVISIGYAVSLIFSGYVSAAIHHKGTIILSITIIGCGQVLIGLAGSLGLVYAALLLMGIGAGFYAPSGVATITSFVHRSNWGRALSLHELGPNLGYIAAPAWATLLSFFLPWRGVFLITGGICIAVGLVYVRFLEVGRFPGEVPSFATLGPILRNPSFWFLLIPFLFAAGAIQGLYSLMPAYLITEVGMDTVSANNLVSLSRIPPLFTIMAVGYIYERIGPVRTLFGLMLLVGFSVIFLGIARGAAVPVAVLVQPAFTAMFFPAGLTAVATIGPASSRNLILSAMFIFISIVAMGLVPLFIGYMGDYYSFTDGFLLFGIATLLVTPLVLKLKI